MGCLSSLEVPLSILITIVFLVNGLYSTICKTVVSDAVLDEEAFDAKDMLMSALAIMSLIGICSSRRAYGVFTLVFMLHAFFFSMFHLSHLTALFIKSIDQPCKYLRSNGATYPEETCHAVNGLTLVCAVISMVACTLATMAVAIRLTTVTIKVSDMRSMATTRSFDNSLPQLVSRKAIESEREEDVETEGPRRKVAMADIFV